MNTHDIDIELPPLPAPYQSEYVSDYFTDYHMEDYARAAIEADRKRRGEPDFFTYVINGHHRGISETAPPDDSYDEGTLQPLYTAPQPAEPVPEGFVPVAAFDRLQALADSQAARIMSLEDQQEAEPVNVPVDKAWAVGNAFALIRRLTTGEDIESELRNAIRKIAAMPAEPVKAPSEDGGET